MKITDSSGVGTMGLTGILITAGVIWGQLSPWWLIAGIFMITAGIGQENSKNR